ncbi:MAG: ComEC/Rec2 family competence protein [Bacteroidota bacterium]
MVRWVPYPFLRLSLALIAGILLGIHHNDLPAQLAWGVFSVGMVGLLTGKFCYRRGAWAGGLAGTGGLLALMAFGYLYTQARTPALHPDHLIQQTSPITHLKGTIITAEDERANTWRTRLSVSHLRTDSGWQAASGTLVLYQRKDSLHQPLQYGDEVLVAGSPRLIDPPGNPGAFDYQRYMANQGVYHQMFASGADLLIVDYQPPSYIKALALQAQQAFADRLAEVIVQDRERSIVWALVLGVKDGLDPETRQAYATAGAMHVLAVSGLHVGIVYLIFLKLLGGLRRRPFGRWVFALMVLVSLWGYAVLTGLSPSVMRAATMFSFMVLAQTTQRKVSTYNTLAASAFLLLLVNPFLITSVGFQLSYLAVFGIVYLQPRIAAWWTPKYATLDWAWQLTTVSMAAQIATGPLAVYYFHVFPTYFFLSNLLVVPLATIILVGGLLVLLLSVVSLAASDWVGQLLEWTVWGMNEVIFALEKIPGSRMEDLVLSPMQVVFLFLGLFAFLAFWELRKFQYLVYTLACWGALVFIALQVNHRWSQQQGFTVYQVRGAAVHSVYWGTQRTLSWNDTEAVNEADYGFNVRPHEQLLGFQPATQAPLADSTLWQTQGPWRVCQWRGKTIGWLPQKSRFTTAWPESLSLDYLLVSHDAIRSLDELPEGLEPGLLILDSSNKSYIAARLQTDAEALGWAVHSVPQAGAFTAIW